MSKRCGRSPLNVPRNASSSIGHVHDHGGDAAVDQRARDGHRQMRLARARRAGQASARGRPAGSGSTKPRQTSTTAARRRRWRRRSRTRPPRGAGRCRTGRAASAPARGARPPRARGPRPRGAPLARALARRRSGRRAPAAARASRLRRGRRSAGRRGAPPRAGRPPSVGRRGAGAITRRSAPAAARSSSCGVSVTFSAFASWSYCWALCLAGAIRASVDSYVGAGRRRLALELQDLLDLVRSGARPWPVSSHCGVMGGRGHRWSES